MTRNHTAHYEAFEAGRIVSDAYAKLARRTRLDLLASRITRDEFNRRRTAQNAAYDRRHDQIRTYYFNAGGIRA